MGSEGTKSPSAGAGAGSSALLSPPVASGEEDEDRDDLEAPEPHECDEGDLGDVAERVERAHRPDEPAAWCAAVRQAGTLSARSARWRDVPDEEARRIYRQPGRQSVTVRFHVSGV